MSCETWIDIIDFYVAFLISEMIILVSSLFCHVIQNIERPDHSIPVSLGKGMIIVLAMLFISCVAISFRYEGMFFCTYEEAQAYKGGHWIKKGKYK